MAWELQTHMHGYIAPSIHKAAQEENDPHGWLCERYADQRWDESTLMAYNRLVADAGNFAQDTLINEITESTIAYASTSNGGHRVYLDNHTGVEWCTENEMLAWHG